MQFRFQADEQDVALLAAIEDGLPLCETPYTKVGDQTGMSEEEVLNRLQRLLDNGIIKRFGMVLQHRPLGYNANAMVVWDIPDDEVDKVAERIAAHDFVTLCYCRTRRAPLWAYNLYCMIHGRERAKVEEQIIQLKNNAGLASYPSQTLFSRRRFKQQGARFSTTRQSAKETV